MKISGVRGLWWVFLLVLVSAGVACAETTSAEGDKKEVPPGINDRFVDPAMNVDRWVETFEGESREVYTARHEVVAQCGIKQGQRIADIGAGTGFYTRLFAEAAGDKGWVYAVEISTRFLEHINEGSVAGANITAVLGREDSVQLPPASIDMAFLSDTYHHLEHVQATLRSIHQALAPGGTLVIVDFERIPDKSNQWTLGHVRAGKDAVRQEIEAANFEFVEEKKVDGFQENYFLRFRKK